jgi:hypothetical protein
MASGRSDAITTRPALPVQTERHRERLAHGRVEAVENAKPRQV